MIGAWVTSSVEARTEQVWQALEKVMDPCSVASGCPLSLVEMQLVRSVRVTSEAVEIELQLTEPSCMLSFHIAEEVRAEVGAVVDDETDVDVHLTYDPTSPWTEDRILPGARERLESFRRGRPLLPTAR
jgi:metal-sulfur cluster biosynthetic enzyme